MKSVPSQALRSRGLFFGLGWGDLVGVVTLWAFHSVWMGGWSFLTFLLLLPLSVIRLQCRPRMVHTWVWFLGQRLFQPRLWIHQRERE